MIDSRPRRSSKKKSVRKTTRRRRLMETLEPRQLLASLAGEVWGDTNQNGIREPGEEGIANVRVYLDNNGNNQLDEGELFTDTNELGQFVFDQLAAGSHTVRLDLGEGSTQSSPGSYYGSGYTVQGAGQTQLYQMSVTGEVTPIGVPNNDRIHALVRTNDGEFFGSNFQTDAIYTIDGETGVETILSSTGQNIAGGMAYDPATDTIYTLAQDPLQPNHQILQQVDQTTGALTPIGPGLAGLNNTSDLTFDTVNNRIVGFDNNDDEFFAFDLDGNGTSLSNTSAALNSWSLAFNGTEFVMFDQDDADKTSVLSVDPDTGDTSPAFEASTRIPTEALLFANAGDSGQTITLADADDARGIDFGVFGNVLDGDGNGNGDGQLALGGFYINELVLDPLFGDTDTMQFVEIRGDDNGVLPENAYFVVVNDTNFNAGRIEQVFDLSNQPLGSNGFLTLLQQGNPYQVDAGSTALVSEAEGFGGLPIFSDISQTSDNISTGSNSYFLIESALAPQPGADIDADNNGQVDDSVSSDWTVLDSVSVHEWVTGGDQAYGQILLVEEGLGVPDPLEVPPGAEIVVGEGYGYAARIGDSLGHSAKDWVFGTVKDEATGSEPFRLGLEDGILGGPQPTGLHRS